MNIISKLDEWYRAWRGHSHINDSNQLLFDSADCQDFAGLCVENALSERQQGIEVSDNHDSKALSIADVGKWVAVEDALPENDNQVIVWWDKERIGINEWWEIDKCWKYNFKGMKVEKWMKVEPPCG